jgi:hypothetical protein
MHPPHRSPGGSPGEEVHLRLPRARGRSHPRQAATGPYPPTDANPNCFTSPARAARYAPRVPLAGREPDLSQVIDVDASPGYHISRPKMFTNSSLCLADLQPTRAPRTTDILACTVREARPAVPGDGEADTDVNVVTPGDTRPRSPCSCPCNAPSGA